MSHTVRPPSINGPDPEFVDHHGMRDRFAISRSLAYDLVGDGLIESVSLRRTGRAHGKRLFVVASVLA